MSEETNEGTMSGLKKAIIAAITTAVTAGGGYFATQMFGGGEEEHKTEQSAPAQQAPITINVQQNQENKQKVENGGGTKVIERVIEKPAASQAPAETPKPKKQEEETW